MPYNLCLFDLDGTLTDPKIGITKSYQYALSAFGIKEELEDLTKFIGPPLREVFKIFYTAPHLHCHLFPRYLDDDFPGGGIDVKLTEPSPYESDEEFKWFFNKMKEKLHPNLSTVATTRINSPSTLSRP